MNSAPPTPDNDPNLSGLGRALLDTGGSRPSGPWVPPTAEELHAILPQYEIVKMLGRGGMGAVYMGRQTSLERPVAIKILSAQLEESDRGFTERFKNEAKAMAKLNHPGIVSVYDFGTTSGGLLYIVMEYVDGTDVAKMIAKSGRLHTEHAMAITAHVCDALAYAHERGIIHRDIKPANIMVGYDGAVKVADFGLAKVNAGGQTLGLTQSGMAMGTMHYMAPEALMLGTSVDHRADIYAVGVMLYQMLTGKLPQGMFKLPSLLVPGLDPRYDAIVRKALMEDRESRYHGIREMRTELDSILTQPVMKVEPAASAADMKAAALPTGARPQRPGARPPARLVSPSVQTAAQQRPSGSLAWLWVTLLVLAVFGGIAWVMFGRPDAEVPAQTSVSSPSASPAQTSSAPTASVPASKVPVSTPAVASDLAASQWMIPFSKETHESKAPVPQERPVSSEFNYVESDESFGILRWEFADPRLADDTTALITKAHLRFHTAKEALAETKAQIVVYLNGVQIGSHTGAEPDQWINVDLDPTRIPRQKAPFELELRCGANAVIVHNKNSLFMARLVLTVSRNSSSPAMTTDAAGWISLFNGKDLTGWELQPSNFPADVQDGAIRIRGSSTIPVSGNMYYRGSGAALPQWTDFELICTIKTENKGNSGIFFHASPGTPDRNRANGIEVQVLNDPAMINVPFGTSGSLQRVLKAGYSSFRDNEWFQIKTIVEGRRVQVFLKKLDAPQWQQVVDWIQPADWTPPTDRPGIKLGSGTISLQNNPPIDGVVWFKDIQFRELNVPAVSTSAPPAAPTALVETFNGHRYQFVPGSASWTEAKAKAESMGGHLATLTTKEENEWLLLTYRKLLTTPNRNIWLGASESAPGAGWKWVTGEPFTPLGWFPGEPNDTRGGGGQAGHPFMLNLYSFRDNGVGWNDSSTHESQSRNNIGFIVEWDSSDSSGAPSTPAQNDEQSVLGTWLRTSSSPNDLYAGTRTILELLPQNLARWTIDGVVKNGNWSMAGPNTIEGKYASGWAFSMKVLRDSNPMTLIVTSKSPKGIPDPSRYEKTTPTSNSAVASATLWIDTKGRSLQAKFVRMQGGNVVLDIAGKATPVALASLSVASQQIAQTLQASLSAPASKIPSDALTFGASRYAYYPGTFTWKEAKAKAEALGGHLATVTTAAEDAWVITNFESKVSPGGKQFWIGASQEKPSLPWQWVTGETFSYTQWAPAEPNNAKGTDLKSIPPYMLGYLIQGGRMGWNDFSESQGNWRNIIVGYLVEWDNTVSAGAVASAPAEAGFISLLDADQPGDWVQVGPGKLDIQNGVATTSSPSKWGVAIYSKRTFADFILKAEFKGMSPLFNSGLWLRIADLRNDISQAEASRYEVGIVHSSGDRGRFTGSIWGIQPVSSDALKANDWNELEVTVTGQRYVVRLNGQIVNDFTGSKGVSGYIGLEENFAGPVQFRNVRVKPLP